jgi:hypothetical protein
MKALIIFSFFFVLVFSSDAQTYPSPEFNNQPAYYDTTTHTLIALEKSRYNKLAQAKGLMGKEAGFFINHAQSPIRLKVSPTLYFIIKVIPGTDPSYLLDFAAFEIRGDQRLLITTKLTRAGTKSTTTFEKIPFEVKKIEDGLYLLTAINLKSGEYLFGSPENMFAFGIDN